MIKRLLILFALVVLTISLSAQPDSAPRWTVVRDGTPSGSAPVQLNGEQEFVDALSLCDALGVMYQRDDHERYIFSLPGIQVMIVPDGSFAQVGDTFIHFAQTPYREGYRLYVSETFILETLREALPGTVFINPDERTFLYERPQCEVLSVHGADCGDSLCFEFQLARIVPCQVEVLDTSSVAVTMEGLRIQQIPANIPAELASRLAWNVTSHQAIIHVPFRIGRARLEGPTPEGLLTLVIIRSTGNGSSPLAYGDRDIGESLQADRRAWGIDKIVVDAGHGGRDPGAVGPRDTWEKTMALDMALRLRDQIHARIPGVEVIMTRDDDTFIPLQERTSIANREGGKLFVSIHCNGEPRGTALGQITFFLSPARTERAMRAALLENSVIEYEDSETEYMDLTEENFILLSMAQAMFVQESEEFANLVQTNMNRRTGLRDRGIDQAGFYVLVGASMPAILVETGFITTRSEEAIIRTENFRQQVAAGICDGIIQFMELYEE